MTELYIRRGDTWKRQATFAPGDNLLGATLWFTVKKHERDPDNAAVVRLRSDGVSPGIVIEDSTHATITISAELSALLPKGTLRFDLQVKLANGEIYTADEGALVVAADITRSTT